MKFIPNWLSEAIALWFHHKRHKKWKLGDNFLAGPDMEIDFIAVYPGLKVKIRNFKIHDDFGRCGYDYVIIDNPHNVENSSKLARDVGDVLMVILEDTFAVKNNLVRGMKNESNEDEQDWIEEKVEQRIK